MNLHANAALSLKGVRSSAVLWLSGSACPPSAAGASLPTIEAPACAGRSSGSAVAMGCSKPQRAHRGAVRQLSRTATIRAGVLDSAPSTRHDHRRARERAV